MKRSQILKAVNLYNLNFRKEDFFFFFLQVSDRQDHMQDWPEGAQGGEIFFSDILLKEQEHSVLIAESTIGVERFHFCWGGTTDWAEIYIYLKKKKIWKVKVRRGYPRESPGYARMELGIPKISCSQNWRWLSSATQIWTAVMSAAGVLCNI